MKKVLIYLDDSVGSTLVELAKSEHRSVKAMAEKIVIDYFEKETETRSEK
jgi:predicted transcriptional regulator